MVWFVLAFPAVLLGVLFARGTSSGFMKLLGWLLYLVAGALIVLGLLTLIAT